MPSESFTTCSSLSKLTSVHQKMQEGRELPVISILPPLSCRCNNWTMP